MALEDTEVLSVGIPVFDNVELLDFAGPPRGRDPTAANLWPFAMVGLIALTAVLFGVFLLARRLLL